MFKISKLAAISVVVLVAGCGGGGGSGGSSNQQYTITVRSDKSQLPINLASSAPSIGAYATFTTTLYVEARAGNNPIPGGPGIFGCILTQGLDSGALYYLDGDPAHEDDQGNPLAYRSVTLGANSGAASFHFHASTKAGTARVVCSVTNPSDSKVYSASAEIVVGAATGKPASVVGVTQAPRYLGSMFNTSLIRNNVGIQALVMDDANQPVPDPVSENLQVRIVPFGASTGARLVSGIQSGDILKVRTIGGIGSLSLLSGQSAGTILLEFTSDRFDNNINNGIQDPVVSLRAVPVVDLIGATAPAIADTAISVKGGAPFAYALTATGGVPPYSWSASNLPAGLTLDSTGVISGTTALAPGDFSAVISVTDAAGVTVRANVKFTIT